MIEERTEELASLYVLDLLEPGERLAFERSLATSPELKRLVRELSAGLYATAKEAASQARPDLLPAVLARARASVKEIDGDDGTREAVPIKLPWKYIWPVAALLFLGLNLVLLILLSEQSAYSTLNRMANHLHGGSQDGQTGESLPAPPADRETLEARITRLEKNLAQTEAALEAAQQEREKLASENEKVRTYNAGWRREYVRLAARFLPFFESKDGLSRFTVIEMVDATTFDVKGPRPGFTEIANRFLTGGANIAGVSSDEIVGPVFQGAGVDSANPVTDQAGLTPIAREGATADQGGTASVDPKAPATPNITGSEAAGFTVWRDDEQKGFLDLYNVPMPTDGGQAFLWVRSSELEPYIPVGELPNLDNGTGSMFYSVDEPNFTPTEILITEEPPNGPGSEPSGKILLRGP